MRCYNSSYGKQIVAGLSQQLVKKHGKNFELRNLRRMMQFAEQFTDFEIVSQLATRLSWSHFVEILPLKLMEAKMFYANEVVQKTRKKKHLSEYNKCSKGSETRENIQNVIRHNYQYQKLSFLS
ncbi:hypothetical protein FACS189465_2850 [Clostridia bacterium]|nr:hypothetical protein FACS189465_2850 [Clostridia bacterium]